MWCFYVLSVDWLKMTVCICPLFQCILENLDLSGPVHISVQTLGSNGLYAEKVLLIYRGKHTQFRTDHTRVNTASAAPCTDPAYLDCRTPPTHRHSGSTQPVSSTDMPTSKLTHPPHDHFCPDHFGKLTRILQPYPDPTF